MTPRPTEGRKEFGLKTLMEDVKKAVGERHHRKKGGKWEG